MSGVTGAARIKSRADFSQFIKSYEKLLQGFPGFISVKPSGSFNSDLSKQDFGDVDLIVHIASDLLKPMVKKQLADYLEAYPTNVIVPFSTSNPKNVGKRHYNSGEIVTVQYYDSQLKYSVQIDNIVALSDEESQYKQAFLDFPADIQGLILGLVKVATVETPYPVLLKKIGVPYTKLQPNQEYEFNASPVELQLRLVETEPGTYTQLNRTTVWTSKNIADLEKILYQYNLHTSFNGLLAQAVQIVNTKRARIRIAGVFTSMISVKSGEVGTPKGTAKIKATDAVARAFLS